MREDEARAAFGLDDASRVAEAPGRPRDARAAFAGFEETYSDFTDYILRCTHRIWERRGVGLIETHYAEDSVLWTSAGVVHGAEAVVNNTLATLAAFPDRSLYGEAVVSAESAMPDGRRGLLSSHRILSAMVHHGHGEFGPPTGRRAYVRTVADCFARANRIEAEWLVRDNLGAARQLGLDPFALARRMGYPSDNAFRDWRGAELDRVRGGGGAPLRAPSTGAQSRLAEAWSLAWNARLFGPVRDLCAPGVLVHAPGARRFAGGEALVGWLMERCAALPGARVAVDHAASVALAASEMVALRWTLAGRHGGGGVYGDPTGRDVLLVGVAHARFDGAGRVAEAWIVADELAALRQVLAAP